MNMELATLIQEIKDIRNDFDDRMGKVVNALVAYDLNSELITHELLKHPSSERCITKTVIYPLAKILISTLSRTYDISARKEIDISARK